MVYIGLRRFDRDVFGARWPHDFELDPMLQAPRHRHRLVESEPQANDGTQIGSDHAFVRQLGAYSRAANSLGERCIGVAAESKSAGRVLDFDTTQDDIERSEIGDVQFVREMSLAVVA